MSGSYDRWGKRAVDAAVSGAALVALGPVLLAIAAAIKLTDEGPVLFRQTRMGRGFKPFQILKFRTMRAGGSGPKVTMGGDPRVTRIGKLLRRTKLDELPQLLNVLKGDMSLVGPRPEVPEYVERFRGDYERVLSIRPGITDYAAVQYSDEESVLAAYDDPETAYVERVLPAKLALYRRYLDERGPRTDLGILLATVAKLAKKPLPVRYGPGTDPAL